MTGAAMMNVMLVSGDLMFASKVSAACQRARAKLNVAASAVAAADMAAAEGPNLVIFDLTMPALDMASAVPRIRAAAAKANIIAYGPHVDETRLVAAQAAGCDEVLTRGQFHAQMDSIVSGTRAVGDSN